MMEDRIKWAFLVRAHFLFLRRERAGKFSRTIRPFQQSGNQGVLIQSSRTVSAFLGT
jgi:hypothetical protein